MRCVDANILVYAHRPESPDHELYREWLEAAMVDDEPLGVIDTVLAGFVRVVTHPRIFADPTPVDIALQFADAVRTAPAAIRLAPGERTWGLFRGIVEPSGATGGLVLDAFLAAVAVEHNAALVSADRSFARFPDVGWKHPLDHPRLMTTEAPLEMESTGREGDLGQMRGDPNPPT